MDPMAALDIQASMELDGMATAGGVEGPTTGGPAGATGFDMEQATAMQGVVQCFGDGSQNATAVPQDLLGDTTVTAVFAGPSRSCVNKAGGELRCWGAEDPAAPPGDLGPVKQMHLEQWYTCAITAQDLLRCWGDSLDQWGVPIPPPSELGPVKSVSTAPGHLCAVTAASRTLCFGRYPSPVTAVPADLQAPGAAAAVAVGQFHACILTAAGAVRCHGIGRDGQLAVPPELALNGSAVALSAGELHTCALTAAGHLSCFGYNGFRQCRVPASLQGKVAAVSVSGYHTCVLTAAGAVLCWGMNEDGQCDTPQGMRSALAVATGDSHSCVLSVPPRCQPGYGLNKALTACLPCDDGTFSLGAKGSTSIAVCKACPALQAPNGARSGCVPLGAIVSRFKVFPKTCPGGWRSSGINLNQGTPKATPLYACLAHAQAAPGLAFVRASTFAVKAQKGGSFRNVSCGPGFAKSVDLNLGAPPPGARQHTFVAACTQVAALDGRTGAVPFTPLLDVAVVAEPSPCPSGFSTKLSANLNAGVVGLAGAAVPDLRFCLKTP